MISLFAEPSTSCSRRTHPPKIAVLERQLEAYNARASTAHLRLLKTIDVLDSLRTQHALEMSSLARERLRFTQDANRWRTVARTLEIERDEMKGAVEDLIEKSAWTHCRISQA